MDGCSAAITPILTFPRRGGRDFERAIIAALHIDLPLSAYQGEGTGAGGLTLWVGAIRMVV